jgi:transcriptional regulator with XRE-family HTH domain
MKKQCLNHLKEYDTTLYQLSRHFLGKGIIMENREYNKQNIKLYRGCFVPKRVSIAPEHEDFGQRIAQFRKVAGLTQRELASEMGISQRMVAYYEKHADTLPAHLLPGLTKTLGVSTDAIISGISIEKPAIRKDHRLWKRFHEVEKLPSNQRRQITQLLDTFIAANKQLETAT